MIALQRLMRMAYKSVRKSQHASLIFKGNAIISAGINGEVLHAEEKAIINLGIWERDKLKGCSIISIRVSNGKLGMALPCVNCMDLIRKVGIRWIIYSDRSGRLEKIRVR